jgi:hypothetical protein
MLTASASFFCFSLFCSSGIQRSLRLSDLSRIVLVVVLAAEQLRNKALFIRSLQLFSVAVAVTHRTTRRESVDHSFAPILERSRMADTVDNRIRVFCSRVRLFDFLRPHDKLNLKRIEPMTALRAIIAAGLPLTKQEFEGVAQEHGYIDEHGLFDYGRFCEDYYDTRPAGYFEKNPDALATEGANGRASAFSVSPLDGGSAGYFVPLSDVEKALLDDTLEKVRHAVRTRGIVIKQFLKDFDEHGKGLVTASRFKRELTNTLPFLKPGEIELLAKAYLTSDKTDVRYHVFHNDVTPAIDVGISLDSPSADLLESSNGRSGHVPLGLTGAAATAAAAGPGMAGIANATRRKPAPEKVMEYKALPSDDVEAIERSVIRQVWERRLKLWDCFCDWDKKRLGELVRPLFHRGLRQANLDGLSPACIDTLADKYALPSDPTKNTINWIEFVEEVSL